MARKPKTESPIFARILSKILEERKLTNKQAAAIAGVSASTIQDWKTGTTPNDLTALKKLSDGLGVTVAYLISGEEDKTKAPHVGSVFNPGAVIFDGYAKIFIQGLVEKNKKTDVNDD